MNIKSSILFSLVISALFACASLFAISYVHAENTLTQNAAAMQKMSPIIEANTPTLPCTNPQIVLTQSLWRGVRGAEVMNLQKFLAMHFRTPESEIATGYFGHITEAHVIRFQKERSISPIGIVGPLTRAALKNVCGGSTNPTGPQVSFAKPMGGEKYQKGDTISVSWYTSNVADHTGMSLKLATADGDIIKSMVVPFASGTAQISTTEFCNGDFSDAIYGDCENLREALKNGTRPFKILAGLYTPEAACFGFCAPSTTPTIILKETQSAAFTMTDPDADAFTATNIRGKAPLTTKFLIAREGKFTLNFGDETDTSLTVPGIVCIKAPCNPPPKEISHMYKKPGTYHAALTRTTMNTCEPNPGISCPMWVSREENMGYVTIEVTK